MAQLQSLPLYTEHLSLWLSDKQGLVFHHGEKSLLKLEPLSIALLIALDEGNNKEQTLKQIQQHSGLTIEEITPSYEQVAPLLKYSEIETTYADGKYPELQNHFEQQPNATDFIIQVAKSTFAIACADDELFQHIKTLLAPIAIANFQDIEDVDFKFEIEIEKDGSYTLYSNDLQVEGSLVQNQVMPVFIDRLQILAYQQSDYCFGFHGAALTALDPDLRQDDDAFSRHSRECGNPQVDDSDAPSRKREPQNRHSVLDTESSSEAHPQEITVLLPGVSGAGKSTLTAELSKLNFQVYSDEIIALNNQLQLTAIKLPMAIKSGSWQLTQSLYPNIANQPQWHRKDGRILKYIWPEQFKEIQNNEAQLNQGCEPKQPEIGLTNHTNTFLLSPCYNAQAQPTATKLSVTDTLSIVTNGGYQLGVELTIDRVEQLLCFCEQINAYQITYANSEQALALVKQLTDKDDS